ncbi:hypothetical protein [Streptococcus jiangjianxini]|uniref:hypothetical protein n=1 Tax=Streptococcus jiangjianxini TaxID=3161189 RepID=UPI0032EAA9D8
MKDTDTITISKAELQEMIAEAIANNTLPRKKKDFRDVAIRDKELEEINSNFPIIAERLKRSFASQQTDEPSAKELRTGLKSSQGIYTRRRYENGYSNYTHRKLYTPNVSDMIRHLSLAVMGASIIKDLDDDEFEHCLEVYGELKKVFLGLYKKRLEAEERILETKLERTL